MITDNPFKNSSMISPSNIITFKLILTLIIGLIVIYLESKNEKSLIILENLQKQHCFDSIAIFIYLLDIKSINKCWRSHFDLIDWFARTHTIARISLNGEFLDGGYISNNYFDYWNQQKAFKC
jgi:hypothetical protein